MDWLSKVVKSVLNWSNVDWLSKVVKYGQVAESGPKGSKFVKSKAMVQSGQMWYGGPKWSKVV